ncbi:MAG TPA: hypothetical protein VE733_25365 [Streptosporangiaceae bacterium]|jgi:hypothetical protein|nr:hypothetical protein [Streptosporangiaceae bacterium]
MTPAPDAEPLRKTRTAADYAYRHARGQLARAEVAEVLRAIAAYDAATGPSAMLRRMRDLIIAVQQAAGSALLKANADDPDIARFNALVEEATGKAADAGQDDAARDDGASGGPADGGPADLDEILAAVLWARYGPAPG